MPFTMTASVAFSISDMKAMKVDLRNLFWLQLHAACVQDLVQAIGRTVVDRDAALVEMRPSYTRLVWRDDPNVAAYCMEAEFFPTADLSSMLIFREEPSTTQTAPIRFITACGCESNTEEWPLPLPLDLPRLTTTGEIRVFVASGVNVFGTSIYREMSAQPQPRVRNQQEIA